MSDLRGKTLVLAQNSPSHFFALNALINAGVQPAEVNFKFTQDAFQAAAAFNADKTIAGCVSWAPDIYNLAKVRGNRMLVTTGTANKLIADVWFARADFAKDNPDIIEGLARGNDLDPLQEAFIATDAFQCGFCTSGQIMSLHALLEDDPEQSDEAIVRAVTGNICRCGAYPNIIEAGRLAAQRRASVSQ